jgi:hypothetical protein
MTPQEQAAVLDLLELKVVVSDERPPVRLKIEGVVFDDALSALQYRRFGRVVGRHRPIPMDLRLEGVGPSPSSRSSTAPISSRRGKGVRAGCIAWLPSDPVGGARRHVAPSPPWGCFGTEPRSPVVATQV